MIENYLALQFFVYNHFISDVMFQFPVNLQSVINNSIICHSRFIRLNVFVLIIAISS